MSGCKKTFIECLLVVLSANLVKVQNGQEVLARIAVKQRLLVVTIDTV